MWNDIAGLERQAEEMQTRVQQLQDDLEMKDGEPKFGRRTEHCNRRHYREDQLRARNDVILSRGKEIQKLTQQIEYQVQFTAEIQ